jgi:hypothetical protein
VPSNPLRSTLGSEALGHILAQNMHNALPKPWVVVDLQRRHSDPELTIQIFCNFMFSIPGMSAYMRILVPLMVICFAAEKNFSMFSNI